MLDVKIIEVKAVDDGMRLNRWFLKYYPSLPMSKLQKLLRTKQIKVDGKRAETSCKLEAGQVVRIPPFEEKEAEVKKPRELSKKDIEFVQGLVIYKDDNIIILNKPAGIAVQGGTGTKVHIDGMLDGLKFEAAERPRLVHRIDKETSGVLLLARNRKWADVLTRAFREHSLQKTYLALVVGRPQKMSGEISISLEKVGERSMAVEDGKPAVTEFEVLDSVGKNFALVQAMPITGRTHQIRAHMECIGTPIVGDDKYFGGGERKKFENFADKLHLHAYKIDLSGIYNKKMVVVAKLPDYFVADLETVGINFRG